MECQFVILLFPFVVYGIASVDELLEDSVVLFADAVYEITVGVRNIHVPCTAPVPIKEVHSLVELLLC